MTSNKLNVRVNINDSQSPISEIVKLTLEDNLSVVRESLKNDATIKMNNTLLFSKKFTDNKLAEISRENEKDFTLRDIIEKSNDTTYTLYLIKTSTYWKFLNDKHKLDFGCTMTSSGIKRASQRAFITEACQLNELDINKEKVVKFYSLEDRMIKNNLFFVPNMNVKYFARIGIKHENEYFKDNENITNITYKCQVHKKEFIKIGNLKATDNFIKKVNDALKLEDPKKFVQITEEFGQFIPTEVILGQRFQIDNNNTKEKEDSLNDYRKWNIIELREPISIFELVDDDLREKLYSFFGKRILYSEITLLDIKDIEDNKDDKTKIIELPQKISELISSKHADCSIFATAIGIKDYYHCQIFTSPDDKEQKLIIHHFNGKDSQLKIGWMVVGNDTNFKSIFPDYNTTSFNNTRFKIFKINYNLSDDVVFNLKTLKLPTEKPYYIGIPYTNNQSDPVIGHYFSNDREKLYRFAYSPKDKQCVKLPEFRLHLLEMTNSSTIFEKYMNNNINLDNIDEFKKFDNVPKFISLYSKKDGCRSIFLKQHPTQVKVKFFNNKPSFNEKVTRKLSDDNKELKCSFFIPFERYFISLYILIIFLYKS
jgi:hypothetical protein